MNIILVNVAEAGMPEAMAENCRILVERRINKEFPDSLPEPGAEVTILYSDKDPLGTSDEVDDQAYFIYFTVEEAEGANRDQATLQLSLVF